METDLSQLKPLVNIGKNGVTQTVIEEIGKHLKKRKIVKIKLLKSFRDGESWNEQLDQLVSQLHCNVLQKRGYTVILQK